MEDGNALIYVLGAIALLWMVGQLLCYGQQFQLPGKIARKKHYKIDNELHVVDLDRRHVQELQTLITKKDINGLATFIAEYKPIVVEVWQYISSLKRQNTESLSESTTDGGENHQIKPLDRVVFSKHSFKKHFQALDKNDLFALLEFDENTHRTINREFIRQFGGDLFMEYFIIYSHLCRENPAVFHIPPGNKLRGLFETLVDTHVALHGKQIKLKDRLKLFHLAQLNQIAANLNYNKYFQTKEEAIQALSKKAKTEDYFSIHFQTSDVYKLITPKIDFAAVEKEWSAYNAYAKIICEIATS